MADNSDEPLNDDLIKELEGRGLAVLQKAEKAFGHTALPSKIFAKNIANFLNDADIACDELFSKSEFIRLRLDQKFGALYSTQKSHLLEKQVAEQLRRIATTFNSNQRRNYPSSSRHNNKLSDEQKSAIDAALKNGVTVITGGPGTGKTTMVKGLVSALKRHKLSVTLCAPTGKAAKRLGEATGLMKFNPTTIHMHLSNTSRSKSHRYDVMILDECSMIDIELFHNLLSTIPDGAQLILIGDKNQLPPVGAGQPFKDIVELQKIIGRTATKENEISVKNGISGITVAAYNVLSGVEPSSALTAKDNGFEFIDCPKDEIQSKVLDLYFQSTEDRLNRTSTRLLEKVQILSPQKNGSCGISNLNFEIQNFLKSENLSYQTLNQSKKFFVNDKVIQNVNNYDLGVMNGEVGKVTGIVDNELIVTFNGFEKRYGENELADLDLAYAVSIHKSQGSEFDTVIIPISSEHNFILNKSLVYTAITRGKSKVYLIGERNVFRRVILNKTKGFRYTDLQNQLKLQGLGEHIDVNRLTKVYRQR